MGWTETNAVNERRRFIADHASGHWTMTDLCARYGINRKTGHMLVRRFVEEGEAAFEERSRAPKSCPHRTADDLEALIIAEREARGWGARKLLRASATDTRTSYGLRAAPSTTFSCATIS